MGRLPKSVFDVSKKMLTESSRNPISATVEKEAGWLLLASLIGCMPKEVTVCRFVFNFDHPPILFLLPLITLLSYVYIKIFAGTSRASF